MITLETTATTTTKITVRIRKTYNKFITVPEPELEGRKYVLNKM